MSVFLEFYMCPLKSWDLIIISGSEFLLPSAVYRLCIILVMLPVLWHINPAVDFIPQQPFKTFKDFARDDFNEGGNVRGCSSFHMLESWPNWCQPPVFSYSLWLFLSPPLKRHNFQFLQLCSDRVTGLHVPYSQTQFYTSWPIQGIECSQNKCAFFRSLFLHPSH